MVTIDNATTPEECFKCNFFEHEGVLYSDPRFYLNAKCKRIGQSIGQDITKSKRYPYIDGNYAIMEGERWSQCPLGERTAKIIIKHFDSGEIRFECSACGFEERIFVPKQVPTRACQSWVSQELHRYVRERNYCPHCGIKIVEQQIKVNEYEGKTRPEAPESQKTAQV